MRMASKTTSMELHDTLISTRYILKNNTIAQVHSFFTHTKILEFVFNHKYQLSPYLLLLSKRIVFGNLEGAVRRGRGGKEKEWTDRVQSDIRAFGITGDWKATALKVEVWVDMVTEGGRRLITAWRKEVDAARHRQEEREATRLGKLLSHTEA